ncbi:hypothetical protein SSX86_001975 [Deinandra increscens subsp. villosa]|uniref:Protein kinase domain-containing protein n=1 Tax=Deinandra increscens subsp. villosa TaxID=3103831 RepID=A0AAP0DVH9_9ASTR
MSESGDGSILDQLRIPYDKIKMLNRIELGFSFGYGTVFEGELADKRVAFKKLNIRVFAGDKKSKLLAEILKLSQFRHPNIVSLLWYCDEKSEMILVYEYVAHGNLYERMRAGKQITAIQRLKICLDAARGLHYLHTRVDPTTPDHIGIVHGNIKLSNILLNSDIKSSTFEAKVSGFGFKKYGVLSLPPTSWGEATYTKEFDVYTFGALLLEVLNGNSHMADPYDNGCDARALHASLVELLPKMMHRKDLGRLVHNDIKNEIKKESLETYANIANQCLTKNPHERPKMAEVVKELEKALRLQVTF